MPWPDGWRAVPWPDGWAGRALARRLGGPGPVACGHSRVATATALPSEDAMRRLFPLLAAPPARLCLLGLLVVLAACSAPASGSGPTPSTVVAPNATVIDVADGDTIVVRVAGQRETVRLIGIDTPETKDPDEPVQCFGPEATEATEALLGQGTPVRLERDTEPRDQYGRLLAYVYRTRRHVREPRAGRAGPGRRAVDRPQHRPRRRAAGGGRRGEGRWPGAVGRVRGFRCPGLSAGR